MNDRLWAYAGRQIRGRDTPVQADLLLSEDRRESERAMGITVTVALSQSQSDALVSFTFNLGEENQHTSTLLKKLNAGDNGGAADKFYAGQTLVQKNCPVSLRDVRQNGISSLQAQSESN